MKFLVIYQEVGLHPEIADNDRKHIMRQLETAFSSGLIEDVIFLRSSKRRPHEIIDLSEAYMEVTPIKAEITTIGLDLKDLVLKKST